MAEHLTIARAANILGVCEQTIKNYLKKGYFGYRAVGKFFQINRDEFDAFAKNIHPGLVELESLKKSIAEEYKYCKEEQQSVLRFISQMRTIDVKHIIASLLEKLAEMPNLCERERDFAMTYLDGATVEMIAASNNLSKQRVRQIICKAFRKGVAGFCNVIKKAERYEEAERENAFLTEKVKQLTRTVERMTDELSKHTTSTESFSELTDEDILILSRKLSDCNLSARARNCLHSANINTIGDLLRFHHRDLLKFRNFGWRTLMELNDFVESLNIEHLTKTWTTKPTEYGC